MVTYSDSVSHLHAPNISFTLHDGILYWYLIIVHKKLMTRHAISHIFRQKKCLNNDVIFYNNINIRTETIVQGCTLWLYFQFVAVLTEKLNV